MFCCKQRAKCEFSWKTKEFLGYLIMGGRPTRVWVYKNGYNMWSLRSFLSFFAGNAPLYFTKTGAAAINTFHIMFYLTILLLSQYYYTTFQYFQLEESKIFLSVDQLGKASKRAVSIIPGFWADIGPPLCYPWMQPGEAMSLGTCLCLWSETFLSPTNSALQRWERTLG